MITSLVIGVVVGLILQRVLWATPYHATNYISDVKYTFKSKKHAQQFCDEMNKAQLTNVWSVTK